MRLLFHIFLELIVAALHILACHMVYQIYWTPQGDRRRSRLIWAAVAGLCLLAAVPALGAYHNHFIHVAGFFMSFLYRMRGPYHLLGPALVIAALSTAEAIVTIALIMVRYIPSLSHLPIMEASDPLYYQFLVIACKLLGLSIIKWMALLQGGRRLPDNFRLSLLSLACPLFTFLFCFGVFSLRPYLDSLVMTLVGLFLALLVFSFNLLFIHLIGRMRRIQASSRELELSRQALEQESARYQRVLRQHSETARAMHDIRNQLAVGVGLLRAGQAEEAHTLIDKVYSAAGGPAGGRVTGHPAIDAILDSRQPQMEELDVQVTHHISMPAVCQVAHEDLGIVMGTLLDSAIHACENLSPVEKRYILLTVKQHQDYLCVKVAIPLSPNQADEDDVFLHGLSMSALRLLVEKYDGNVRSREEGNGRSVTVLLRNVMGRTE